MKETTRFGGWWTAHAFHDVCVSTLLGAVPVLWSSEGPLWVLLDGTRVP